MFMAITVMVSIHRNAVKFGITTNSPAASLRLGCPTAYTMAARTSMAVAASRKGPLIDQRTVGENCSCDKPR